MLMKRIGLVCPAHPTDAWLDWDLGNFKAKSTPWTHCCVPQTIPRPFLQCGKVREPAERGHTHQGIPFPWRAVLCLQQCLGTWCTSKQRPHEWQDPRFPSRTLPSLPIFSPGEWHTHYQPSRWCKMKHDSSDKTNFFHCSMVQFWCSHKYYLQTVHEFKKYVCKIWQTIYCK